MPRVTVTENQKRHALSNRIARYDREIEALKQKRAAARAELRYLYQKAETLGKGN
jgi:hypothetical protein